MFFGTLIYAKSTLGLDFINERILNYKMRFIIFQLKKEKKIGWIISFYSILPWGQVEDKA